MAKVDATVEKDLGSRFEVKGFPTLKFFKNGDMVDYSGPREAKGIVSWLEKKTGPPAVDVEDAAGVKALTDKEDVVVVGLFKNQKSDEAKEFIKTADKIDDMKFAITSSEALFKEYKILI